LVVFITPRPSEKLRPDLGGIETFLKDSFPINSFLCEKLRPDLGGIETILVVFIATTPIPSEKLRPDLGGIETFFQSSMMFV